MEMKMSVDEKLVDSIKVYVTTSKDEKYLEWLKEGLRLKHRGLLIKLQKEPVFYLDDPTNLNG